MVVKLFTGAAIQPYIRNLASLRMEVFREYPYLYEGDFDYEQIYLYSYIHANNAAVVLAFDKDEVVGASTCIALEETDTYIQFPFIEKRYDVSKGVYFEESVLKSSYRNKGIGTEFFRQREGWARKYFREKEVSEKGTFTTFCSIERPEDHSYKPISYIPLTDFWHNRGYSHYPDLQTQIAWKEIGKSEEEFHTLSFWIKLNTFKR